MVLVCGLDSISGANFGGRDAVSDRSPGHRPNPSKRIS